PGNIKLNIQNTATTGSALNVNNSNSAGWWAATVYGNAYGLYANGASYALYGESNSGYGGYFYGFGGSFSQNTSGYYLYAGHPGSSWSAYGNGNAYFSDVLLGSTGRWLSSAGIRGLPVYECPRVENNDYSNNCIGQLTRLGSCHDDNYNWYTCSHIGYLVQ
ncbi:MAG: hypothetical protein QMD86_02830, partial [Patescibacteria group bacterium]|nr:hypothetical protein [Patescibacteria group bacterium]